MSNDEFETREPLESLDSAICAVSERAWCLYDDLHTHRLTGRWKVAGDGRDTIARWILFLETDLEYTWPPTLLGRPLFQHPLRCIVTFGAAIGERQPAYQSAGDPKIWPFSTRDDYDRALKHPTIFSRAA